MASNTQSTSACGGSAVSSFCRIALSSPHHDPHHPAPQHIPLTGRVCLGLAGTDGVSAQTYLSISLEAYVACKEHLDAGVDGVRLLRISQTLWQAADEEEGVDENGRPRRPELPEQLAFVLPLPDAETQRMPSSFQSSHFRLHYRLVASLHAATSPVSTQHVVYIHGAENIDLDRFQVPFTRYVPVTDQEKASTVKSLGDLVCQSWQQIFSSKQVTPNRLPQSQPQRQSSEAEDAPKKTRRRAKSMIWASTLRQGPGKQAGQNEAAMVSVSIPATGFRPGDEIPLTINCTEREASRLERVEVELRRKIVIQVSKPSTSSFTSSNSSVSSRASDRSTIHAKTLTVPSHPVAMASRSGRVELRCVYRLPSRTPWTNMALPEFNLSLRLRIVLKFAKIDPKKSAREVPEVRRKKSLFSSRPSVHPDGGPADPTGTASLELKTRELIQSKLEIPITVGAHYISVTENAPVVVDRRLSLHDKETQSIQQRLEGLEDKFQAMLYPAKELTKLDNWEAPPKYEPPSSPSAPHKQSSNTIAPPVFLLNDRKVGLEDLVREQSIAATPMPT